MFNIMKFSHRCLEQTLVDTLLYICKERNRTKGDAYLYAEIYEYSNLID